MSVTAMPAKGEPTEEKPKGKGGKLKKILVIVLALALVGGGVYWFKLRPRPEPKPEPGEVVTLEPIQVNLAGGHYLKVGLALQLTTKAHEADGSKALDAAIELFTGKPMVELTDRQQRKHMKDELEEELKHLYHGDVMDVYFTSFVTQ